MRVRRFALAAVWLLLAASAPGWAQETTEQAPSPAEPTTPGTPEQEAKDDALLHEQPALPHLHWPFQGVFGTFDQAALLRGFQVYHEVCSACHSMNFLYYRNLADLGMGEGEVKNIAAQVTVTDTEPNDQGEYPERPGRPSDRFKAPFPNEQAARAANNGALPPDLSLIVEARTGGADYVHAILTGYEEPPPGFAVREGLYYNRYFSGHLIGMPPPLSEGGVAFADGTPASVEQQATDVAQFLAWAAEPNLPARTRTGVAVMFVLIALTLLLYGLKRHIWADLHRPDETPREAFW